MEQGATRTGPLAGVRVIEVSTVIAGPIGAQILGDYGADVIKIEHPQAPDSLRTHGAVKSGNGLWWKIIARNKRCIGLYLGAPAGADVFKRLVAEADVVVENFRPGTLERWGLGPAELHDLNPRLIIGRVTGFGQTGPYAKRAGFGTLAEAMSGFAAITGEADGPPTLPAMGLADTITGISLAAAVSMALFHRDRPGGSGRGQVIDINLLEPLMCAVGPGPTVYDQLGVLQPRSGNLSTSNAPRNTYLTADGEWLALSASATTIAVRVMHLVGRPDLAEAPWFASAVGRVEHVAEIDSAVATWIGERTAAEVIAAFVAAEAAIAPVYDAAALLDDPQVQATEMITTVDDDDLGPMRMTNMLFRMSETPGSIRHTGRRHGADTDSVLAEVGMSADDIAALRAEGVAG